MYRRRKADFKALLPTLTEVVILTKAVNDGEAAVADQLRANREIIEHARASSLRRNPAVRTRTEALPGRNVSTTGTAGSAGPPPRPPMSSCVQRVP